MEWLREVPEHWNIERLKYISTVNDETLSETTDLDYELLYVDISSVDPVSGIKYKESMTFENAPSRARRKVRHGDVIISTVRTYLRAISPINFPEPNMIVSTGFAVIHPKEGMESQFAAHVLHAPYFVERVVANSVGVSYPAINASQLITFNITLPPLPEQSAIAAFLDRKTGRIDTLIEKKERQVELLQEKRAALISHAVTKGLDPDVNMKDSGVEWLGKVPEGWEIKALKRTFKALNGSTPKSGELDYWDGDIHWATPDDLGQLKTNTLQITQRMITKEGYSSCGTSLAPSGSLVLSTRAPIGHLAIAGTTMCTNQGCRCLVFRADDDSHYFYYQLLAARSELESLGQGSTFKELGRGNLEATFLTTPPQSEQRAIAAFLDRGTGNIDTLTTKIQESISKLREYRTALISAAVTGKIDVRQEVMT